MTNWDGQSAVFTRDASSRLTTVRSGSGVYGFDFAYDATNHVSSVSALDGRIVTYTYDTAGNLASVSDPSGRVVSTFTNDANGRILTERDAANALALTNVWDTQGRVQRQTYRGGDEETYVYDTVNRKTTVTVTQTGEATVYGFDALGRTTSISDADGKIVSMVRRADGEPVGAMDRLGSTLSQSVDANANVTLMTVPGSGTVGATYDPLNRVVTQTAATGAVTTYAYVGTSRESSFIAFPRVGYGDEVQRLLRSRRNFLVSFLSGRVLRGKVLGEFSKGDTFALVSGKAGVTGTVLAIDAHHRPSAPANECSILVNEPLSSTVVPGNVLELVRPKLTLGG